LFKDRGYAVLNEAHEGLDRGQAGIAGTGAVVSHRLQVRQELHHQRRIELFEGELGRRHLEPIACELQEQLKAVGITVAGVGARATLQGKPFPKERANMRCNRRQGFAPCIKDSQASAMSVISCGVFSRYQ
jgi:hypothetical protein